MKEFLKQFVKDATNGAKTTMFCACAAIFFGCHAIFPIYCVYYIINAQVLVHKLIGAAFVVAYFYLSGNLYSLQLVKLPFNHNNENQ